MKANVSLKIPLLGGSFLLAMSIGVDLLMVHWVFQNWAITVIAGLIILVVGALVVWNHYLCLELVVCSSKVGSHIHSLYISFAILGILNLMLFFLQDQWLYQELMRHKGVWGLIYACLIFWMAFMAIETSDENLHWLKQQNNRPDNDDNKPDSPKYGKAGYGAE